MAGGNMLGNHDDDDDDDDHEDGDDLDDGDAPAWLSSDLQSI